MKRRKYLFAFMHELLIYECYIFVQSSKELKGWIIGDIGDAVSIYGHECEYE